MNEALARGAPKQVSEGRLSQLADRLDSCAAAKDPDLFHDTIKEDPNWRQQAVYSMYDAAAILRGIVDGSVVVVR